MKKDKRAHGKRLQQFMVFGLLAVCFAPVGLQAGPIRDLPGFQANVLPANDDGSAPLTPLGFTVNFFGVSFNAAYVNNNGNITFDTPLSTFTPFGLENAGAQIIAPFFADVDTRGAGSGVVTYGNDTVNGHLAFGVNWIHVGYDGARTDKLNSFQLVLIDRSDLGPGDFELEFNYDQIQWETGQASGGVDGLGGSSARAGFSNGSGLPGTSLELAGSGVNGAFLDSNPTGLIDQDLNNPTDGRYLFNSHGGVIDQGLICIQDDRTGDHISFKLTTGEYTITQCSSGQTLEGTGKVRLAGCQVVLQDVRNGRHVFAIAQRGGCGNRGLMRAVDRDTRTLVNIFDSDITNNSCSCQFPD